MERKKNRTKFVVSALALGVLVVFAFNAVGGNLEPASPPGPTMKTLDEVEPRIPIGPDTTPGDINYTYKITKSGSYYLTGNCTAILDGILIDANNVTINLMGYEIIGSGLPVTFGIFMNGRSNVEIRNDTIREFGSHGIIDYGFGKSHRIIDVRSVSNKGGGMRLMGNGHMVKNCTVSDNGNSATDDTSGISVGDNSMVTGNIVCNNGNLATSHVRGIYAGTGSMVNGNTVYGNGTLCEDNVYGIQGWFGSKVTGNTVYDNGNQATGEQVFAITASLSSTVKSNTVYKNGD